MKPWQIALGAIVVFGAVILAFPSKVFAESIATMPNKGGGKIVLTNEVCKYAGKTYSNLNRAYNYTSEGYGSEGCFHLEDDTVVILWDVSGTAQKMRYSANDFTVIKKSSGATRI